MKLFFTANNRELSESVLKKTNLIPGKCEIKKFADQEISVFIQEDVANQEVWVLGSTFPPEKNILELLILIHTLKSNGASKINVIIPYFAYAKADRVKPAGSSMSAKLMVDMIEIAGADTITAINLHSKLVEDFFKKPLNHLSAIPLLSQYFKEKEIENLSIASPDSGGILRAKKFAEMLNIDEIIIGEKQRPDFDEVEITKISGEIEKRNVVIVDDMIQSGGTIIKTAQELKKQGAKNIYVAAVHLVSTGHSVSLLEKEASIKKVVITDTIPKKQKLSSKFEIVSVADLIAKSIKEKI